MGAWEDGFAAGYERGLRGFDRTPRSDTYLRKRLPKRTKKRAAPRPLTAHNRFMKKEMKSLKKKHPRMKQPAIMKKANVAWRKHKRSKR